MNELDDLPRQAFRRARRLATHDIKFAIHLWEIDPVIETPALKRVMNLAGPVTRNQNKRRRAGLDRSKFRYRKLILCEHFKQERIKRLIRPIKLVDQQHRRSRLSQCLKQRSLDQHLARVKTGDEGVVINPPIAAMPGLGQANFDHLPGNVPFVGGLRDIQPFVALDPQQRAAQPVG